MKEIEDVIVLLLILFSLYSFFRSVFGEMAVNQDGTVSSSYSARYKYNLFSNYFPSAIQRTAFRLMETQYIMATSTAVDTVMGRYPSLLNSLYSLRLFEGTVRYRSDIQTAIDRYKAVYPERVPQDFQLALLISPQQFNAEAFYANCLLAVLKRNITLQAHSLVTSNQSGKMSFERILKLIQSVRKELIEKCSSLANLTALILQLSELEEGYKTISN